jgi:(p)ppGpp synthase/HD superfamily hydrolase
VLAGSRTQHGADEDQAIAALLHDAVEDQGGPPTLARIRAEFGDRVASMVAALSDSDREPKPPWRERKERYLAHLTEAPADVLLVSACDKLYNARAVVEDHAVVGTQLWQRFSGGRDGLIWYFGELSRVFHARGPRRLAQLLGETVSRMRSLA